MLISIDFETEAIDNRPDYPPRPVGVAVMAEGTPGTYFAWGHPEGNNCKVEQVRDYLEELLSLDHQFVFHNAPFDCAILEERFFLAVPWERCHDTMLMAFLDDPYGELALKPLADEKLGMHPEERDAVHEWLVRKGYTTATSKSWGAHISKAPGGLVGKYALGDVHRTLALYKYYEDRLQKRGML